MDDHWFNSCKKEGKVKVKNSLKLITLNTWAGRTLYPLMKFFEAKKSEIDIFCLQEIFNTTQEIADDNHPREYVRGTLFQDITWELREHDGRFADFPHHPHRMSLAMFIRKNAGAKRPEHFIIHEPPKRKEKGSFIFAPRQIQSANFDLKEVNVKVVNYHGLWNNGPKTDTPERLVQSEKVKGFLDEFGGPKIICGDFNLLPGTESVRILEKGMRNLITEFGVKSTRTGLYRNYCHPTHTNFADYIFVSPEIKVLDFKVLPDIVSDHSPLYLEFTV